LQNILHPFPCNECAKTIIQNGIKEVIYQSDKYAEVPAFKASKRMLKLAKVKLRQYTHNN
jgi:dCMP deaminase